MQFSLFESVYDYLTFVVNKMLNFALGFYDCFNLLLLKIP